MRWACCRGRKKPWCSRSALRFPVSGSVFAFPTSTERNPMSSARSRSGARGSRSLLPAAGREGSAPAYSGCRSAKRHQQHPVRTGVYLLQPLAERVRLGSDRSHGSGRAFRTRDHHGADGDLHRRLAPAGLQLRCERQRETAGEPSEDRAAHRRLRFPFCRRLLAWQRASARAFPEGCGESCSGQPFPLLVDSGQPLSRLLLPEQQFSAGCGKSLSGDAGIRSAAGRAADPCALSDARFLRPDRDCSGSHGSGFWSDPGSFRSRPSRIRTRASISASGASPTWTTPTP